MGESSASTGRIQCYFTLEERQPDIFIGQRGSLTISWNPGRDLAQAALAYTNELIDPVPTGVAILEDINMAPRYKCSIHTSD